MPSALDYGLEEGWYLPGVHPILLWAVLACVPWPMWCFIVWIPNCIGAAIAKVRGEHYWWREDEKVVRRIVCSAIDACDAVEARLGPAVSSPTKPYPAVSCFGVGHKSGRYLGMWYYLLKHDLVDEKTHFCARPQYHRPSPNSTDSPGPARCWSYAAHARPPRRPCACESCVRASVQMATRWPRL